MTQDDAHIFTTIEDMRDELRKLLTFVLDLLRDYGLDDFYLELSTKNPDKYVGDDDVWDDRDGDTGRGGRRVGPRTGSRSRWGGVLRAEDLGAGTRRDRPYLADVDHPGRLQSAGAVRARIPGRGRRAAPAGDDPSRLVRLDRTLLRRADRALRRCVPAVARAGAGHRHPDHRRARVVPRRRRSAHALRAAGIRFEVDASDERMQKKIRNAQKQKVPFMLIAGDDDVAAGAVSFRYRDGTPEERCATRATPSPRSATPSSAGFRCERDRPDRAIDRHHGAVGVPDGFERIWTPHRMAYLNGENKPAGRSRTTQPLCPFCVIPTKSDEDALIVARGTLAYVVLNLYPYNAGHLLVVPYRHVADITDLNADRERRVHRCSRNDRSPRYGRRRTRARIQRRHEPRKSWPAPALPRTCISTSSRGGAATRTSCRSSAAPGCCRSCSATRADAGRRVAGADRGHCHPTGEEASTISATPPCERRSPSSLAAAASARSAGCAG